MSIINQQKQILTDIMSSCALRKEFENNQLLSKIADEQAINNQLQKKMKELHVMKIKLSYYTGC